MLRKKRVTLKTEGFTLVEILLVIGIIAVLATVVIVSLDPATRFQNARDARRLSDIQSILSAVQQYIVDHKGTLPDSLGTTEMQIGTATSGCELTYGTCSANLTSCLDFSTSLSPYLKELPYDPETGSVAQTHYTVVVDSNNIVTVRACDSGDETIDEVSR